MPTILVGALLIVLGIALSVLGLLLTQRRFPHSIRQPNSEVAGVFVQVVGVFYAVLVAFLVIVVWEEFQSAKAATEQEGTELVSLYRLARSLPAPTADQIQFQVRHYAEVAITDEWPAMADGQVSLSTTMAMDDLWQAVTGFHPQGEQEAALYGESLQRLHTLTESRQSRLLASRRGLPGFMWALLIGGGVITVAFTYFLSTPSTRAQVVMTVLFTALIVFLLFLVAVMDHPFSGDVHVEPDALRLTLRGIDARP